MASAPITLTAAGELITLVAQPRQGVTTTTSCRAGRSGGGAGIGSCGGSLIAGRYLVLERLGEGGMGTVFKARDRALEVTVALKVVRLGREPRAVKRFHAEVRLARKVKHRNVCALYEYGEDGEVVYCTMELVEGKNLRQVLR